MIKLAFIDCETTGTDHLKNALVQVAGQIVIVDGADGVKPGETFDFKMRPYSNDVIEDEALEVNGLTRLELASFPEPALAYHHLQKLMDRYVDRYNRKDKFHFVGYNGDFDANFIRRWFLRNGDEYFGSFFWYPIIDVSKLAGIRLMETRHHLKNFKLTTVAEHLGFSVDKTRTHDASYDIDLTQQMYFKLSKELQQPAPSRGPFPPAA